MNIAITGGHGFLGWHTAVRLHSLHRTEALRLGRDDLAEVDHLAKLIERTSVIIHLAGVNRAPGDEEIETGNVRAAQSLAQALRRNGTAPHIVYANSIHAGTDSAYGRGKQRAGEMLRAVATELGGTLADVQLPNLFGEHGRPGYNSFIATFCDVLASGGNPRVEVDRPVPLLHAQRAAAVLIDAALAGAETLIEPEAEVHTVSEVLTTLQRFADAYRGGQIPALADPFEIDLFNTYRSYVFPQAFPHMSTVHADARGELFETVRVLGGTGQTFVSTTRPGITRGEHYHLTKIERFFVVSGEAEIALRRVLDDDVINFRLSGREPAFVDMPTLWTHNITNVGDTDLITLFWSDQLHDPNAPDTYWENVVLNKGDNP